METQELLHMNLVLVRVLNFSCVMNLKVITCSLPFRPLDLLSSSLSFSRNVGQPLLRETGTGVVEPDMETHETAGRDDAGSWTEVGFDTQLPPMFGPSDMSESYPSEPHEEEMECSVELLEEGEPEHRPVETETESPGVVAAQQV